MKRRNRKSRNPKKPSPAATTGGAAGGGAGRETGGPARRRSSRRDFLVNAAIYSGGAVALAGGSWYAFDAVAAQSRESDLSTIGNGVPAIVQIHDPNCPTCNRLRMEAREAACAFGEDRLQFRVASLMTEEGRALATRHGVGKITLLMFDGDGTMRSVLPGLNDAAHLAPVFQRHVDTYGRGSVGS